MNLIGREFGKFGVESYLRVADRRRPSGRRAITPNTKLLFAETPTNPLTDVCDIRALADIAHNAGACWPWTTASARRRCSGRPKFGADLVIHSGTKYLDGQGRVVAGAICGASRS